MISINSIRETTGGGLYLRSLCKIYSKHYQEFDVACKQLEAGNHIALESEINKTFLFKKTCVTDLLSRVIFCPSFLGLYIFSIMKVLKQYDVIHIHSTRNLAIAFIIRNICRKKVIIHADNVEYKLSKSMMSFDRFLLLRIVDFAILFLWERYLIKLSVSEATFITEDDSKYFNIKDFTIIPVKVAAPIGISVKDSYLSRCQNKTPFKVLFVASFSHQPNIEAFKFFFEVASELRDVEFVVAGRYANKLDVKPLKNIKVRSDVSDKELFSLYETSHAVLSLVNSGSGMKTKVAEALSFNLPVVASRHSLIGYGSTINSDLVFSADTATDAADALMRILNFYNYQHLESFHELWGIFCRGYRLE